jgi:hypothetical protein
MLISGGVRKATGSFIKNPCGKDEIFATGTVFGKPVSAASGYKNFFSLYGRDTGCLHGKRQ